MFFTSDYGIYYVPSDALPLDYDLTPLYSMFVTCSDGTQTSDAREFQVSITPNDAPVPTTSTCFKELGLFNLPISMRCHTTCLRYWPIN